MRDARTELVACARERLVRRAIDRHPVLFYSAVKGGGVRVSRDFSFLSRGASGANTLVVGASKKMKKPPWFIKVDTF